MEREQSCESFDLLLRTLHQVLLLEQSPLSLELGIHDGEVVQAFRTHDEHSRRAIKNALRNVYPTSRLSTLSDDSFRPPTATSMYFADVELENDLYSINRWQQLLTQSDPLSTLLGSLVVNQHARFFGHVSITLLPLPPKQQKIHRKAFEGLQVCSRKQCRTTNSSQRCLSCPHDPTRGSSARRHGGCGSYLEVKASKTKQ